MAVAHDAATEAELDSTAAAEVSHTPVGTPRGVLGFFVKNASATDVVTGMTYGGSAMTRVPTNGFAVDTNTELGSVYAYFLGSSVPTGTQDLVVGGTTTGSLRVVVCITLTAAADLEIVASGMVQENAANPQIALDSGAVSALRYCCVFSGNTNAGTNFTLLSDQSTVQDSDFGAQSMRTDRQTNPSTGSFTVGYTASSDDVAMIGVAIAEVAGAGTTTLRYYTSPFGWNIGTV
jgi:hypothetical protein